MGAGAAIVAGGVAAYTIITGIIGEAKEDERIGETTREKKAMNTLNYNESMQNIAHARENANLAMDQTRDSMATEFAQTSDMAHSQAEDRAENEHNKIIDANNQVTDYEKAKAKEESQALADMATSGVRNTGTARDSLDIQIQENEDAVTRAEEKIDEEIASYERDNDMHFQSLDDYEERYNQKLAQLEDTHELKMNQLAESESILTQKYNLGQDIIQSEYDYMMDGAWMDYTNAILGGLNAGVSSGTSVMTLFG